MEIKYKVGDKVKVRSDIKDDEDFGGICFCHAMTPTRGQIVTIKEIAGNGYYIQELPHGFIFVDDMFETLIYRELDINDILSWLKVYNESDEMFKLFAERDVDGVLNNYSSKEIISKISMYESNKKYGKHSSIETEWVYKCRVIGNNTGIEFAKKYFTEDEFPDAAEKLYKDCLLSCKCCYLKTEKICRVKGADEND